MSMKSCQFAYIELLYKNSWQYSMRAFEGTGSGSTPFLIIKHCKVVLQEYEFTWVHGSGALQKQSGHFTSGTFKVNHVYTQINTIYIYIIYIYYIYILYIYIYILHRYNIRAKSACHMSVLNQNKDIEFWLSAHIVRAYPYMALQILRMSK